MFGNENHVTSVQFAAVAHVAIPEFEEEGGTVKVVFHECDFSLLAERFERKRPAVFDLRILGFHWHSSRVAICRVSTGERPQQSAPSPFQFLFLAGNLDPMPVPRTPAETGGTHLPKIATTPDAETADQIEARGAQLESSRLILRHHLDMRPSVVTSRRCWQRGALRFTT